MTDGRTEVTAVVGSPIRHSLSPTIFNAAFAATGLNWVMVAFDVATPAAAGALAAAGVLGLRGLSVTMPLKVPMAHLVHELSPTAARLNAVNSVRIGDGRSEPGGDAAQPATTAGDNTDGGGLLDALRTEVGWEAKGRSCAVIGAGGAARSVVLALADAGAAAVVVINRTRASAAVAASLGGPVGRIGDPGQVPSVDLVVNATSVGMAGTAGAGDLPLDPTLLGPHQVVVDLVYHPQTTPWLAAAADRGARVVSGVGMLVHQAARQFAWWTGMPAPLDDMVKAARAALDA